MGIVKQLIFDELISPKADRHSNLLRIYRKDNNEIVIHFRNLKINLITPDEIQEWKDGFTEALKNLKDNLKNDI